MCVAIVKEKNIQLPSKDILQICFKNNPDGAGFVVNKNGYNYISKGYFTFEGFYKAFKQASINKEDDVLIHFRVATHGKVNIQNCHPFPIQNSFTNMTKPFLKTISDVMVHNGKLDININNKIYSDSMHFALAINNFLKNKQKVSDQFIQYIIKPTETNKKGNRIAIMSKDGVIKKYGVGWIQKDGIFYSNDSFKIESVYKGKFKTKNKIGFI